MNSKNQRGFSLVELMIAILLATITGAVVLTVLTSYQSRSNTLTGRNDAEINAAMGLYSLEREVRMAGAGLMTPLGPLCGSGVNVAWNGVASANGSALLPLRIIDGGAATDRIEMIRSDSQAGAAPSRLVATMAGPTSQLSVDSSIGLANGDLIMVGATDRPALCTLMQLTSNPTANGSGWLLAHAAGIGNYNPPDPTVTFTGAVSYQVRDSVVNLGGYGIRRYGIVCSNAGVPSATNNCDLAWWNPLAVPAPTLATVNSVAPDIIEMQAQYGISPTPANPTVTQWVDATGAWAAPTVANVGRIKAIRLSLVARAGREGQAVGPAVIALWDAGLPSERARNFTAAEQRFRYQSLTVVIPLINAIWAGS